MAARKARKKTTGSSVASPKKRTTGKKTSATVKKKQATRRKGTASAKTRQAAYKRKKEDVNAYHDRLAFEMGITMLVLFLLAIFSYLCFLNVCGKAGIVVSGLFFGMFGYMAWFLPIGILIGYAFSMVNKGDSRVPRKIVSLLFFCLAMISLSDLVFEKATLQDYYTANHVMHPKYFDCMYLSFKNVVRSGKGSGGILGRLVSAGLKKPFGVGGAAAILIGVMMVSLYLFYGLEWMGRLRKKNAYRSEMESADAYLKKKENYNDPSYALFSNRKRNRNNQTPISVDLVRAGSHIDKIEASHSLDRSIDKIVRERTSETNARKRKKMREQEGTNKGFVVPDFRTDSDKEELAKKRTSAKEMAHEAMPFTEITADVPENNSKVDLETPTPEVTKPNEIIVETMAEPKEETTTEEKHSVPEIEDETPVENTPILGENAETEEPSEFFPPNSDTEEPVMQAMPFEPKEPETLKQERTFSPERDVSAQAIAPLNQNQSSVKKQNLRKEEYVSNSEAFNALNASKNDTERKAYVRPILDLLQKPSQTGSKVSSEQLRMTASKLQSTLASFRVKVSMGPVTCGPSVTRYEIVPAQGVRVSKITNLADDIKLSLAAQSIRIEAPIPGKSAIGIEVPNEKASPVYFRELLENEKFQKSKSKLSFVVGKDIAGKLIMGDIAKMTHLLIAGATGSGKSVCINTLIMSLIYKTDPNDVKMIMIDPKVVELSIYNDIPHLLCPVVSDPKEAAAALNWAAIEMDRRYKILTEVGVRNVDGYNKKIKTMENAEELGYTKMPYIVVIVDEFADLMMVASKSIEDSIKRLSQLARAAGIHLILATQRPSVNVITGVIKANIPSRIAFAVASGTDSRTILDRVGAEKLLGRGDMLFSPSYYPEPIRVQGAFVTDEEVNDVTDYVREHNSNPSYNNQVTEVKEQETTDTATAKKTNIPARDEYFEDAGRYVIDAGRAAAGVLQRRFSIGFNRAGRIVDQLEKVGVVGPPEGTKPRKVLMTMEEFEHYLAEGTGNGEKQEVEREAAASNE